jgi:hypothetical protein
MAFADPQSITIAGTPVSLPRTGSASNAGAFSSNDSAVKLSVSSSYGKRNRRTLRVSHTKIAADPLVPTTNVAHSMSVYIVVDAPISGYTVVQQKEIVDAFTAYLTASTGAKVTQLLGGEN